MKKSDVTVAAYYFPNWHVDPKNELVHGRGWTEWEVVKCAGARFPGHRQPRVPVWGDEDESRPEVMARKISAAQEYGVDAFIFDYYYWEDGSFRDAALRKGFLQGGNPGAMLFALMWCNHPRSNMHPAPYHTSTVEVFAQSRVSDSVYDEMTDHIVKDYFSHPNYWKVDGKPFYAVYSIRQMIQDAGSVEKCAQMLNLLRKKTRKAGFPDLHLHIISCFWADMSKALKGEVELASDDPLRAWVGRSPEELVACLGIKTQSDYAWLCEGAFPKEEAACICKQISRRWESFAGGGDPTFLPTVSTGWDTSPRTLQSDIFEPHAYPWCGTWELNPDEFRTMLQEAKEFLAPLAPEDKICIISAWNEWTEGSYLEPDTDYQYGYLEAIRDVFGSVQDNDSVKKETE